MKPRSIYSSYPISIIAVKDSGELYLALQIILTAALVSPQAFSRL